MTTAPYDDDDLEPFDDEREPDPPLADHGRHLDYVDHRASDGWWMA